MLPLISCISILRESTKDIQLVSLSIMKDDQLLRTHHLQVHLHIDFHMQIKFCVTFQVLTSWQLSDLKGTTSESTNSFLKSVAFHQNLLEQRILSSVKILPSTGKDREQIQCSVFFLDQHWIFTTFPLESIIYILRLTKELSHQHHCYQAASRWSEKTSGCELLCSHLIFLFPIYSSLSMPASVAAVIQKSVEFATPTESPPHPSPRECPSLPHKAN